MTPAREEPRGLSPRRGLVGLRGRSGSPIGPYEPAAPLIHPDDRRLATAALVVLFGYLVLGRSFAQIGAPSANVFLGELLLAGAVLSTRLRRGFTGAVQALVSSGPLHVLCWSMLLFIGYGVFQVALVERGGGNVLEALRVFAFHYYVVFAFVGLALGLRVPDVLERLCRAVPWGVGVLLVLTILGINFSLPLSAAVGLYPGAGAPLVMLMAITLERDFMRRLPAFGVCAFAWLYTQIRGDWLGVGAAVLVWGIVTKRLRLVLAGLLAASLAFVFLDLVGIRISASEHRGGAVGGREIVGRLVAPFDKELGAKLVPDAEVFAGTAQWREDFWTDIREAVEASQTTRLFGLGYGTPLSELTTFINNDVRSPHNVFYFALGYGGWVGVFAFAQMHLVLLAALWKAFRITGNPFGPMMWMFATLTGLFGNFFETPYNSVPYYVLIGICLAPLARSTGWPPSTPVMPARARATGAALTRPTCSPGRLDHPELDGLEAHPEVDGAASRDRRAGPTESRNGLGRR